MNQFALHLKAVFVVIPSIIVIANTANHLLIVVYTTV